MRSGRLALSLSPTHSLGFQLLDWCEHYLVHGPGDVEGDPVLIDDEFASFVLRCYEVDSSGSRVVRRAVMSRPKGRAKSELAAFLAIAEAIGPVRFSVRGSNPSPMHICAYPSCPNTYSFPKIFTHRCCAQSGMCDHGGRGLYCVLLMVVIRFVVQKYTHSFQ